MTPLHFILAGGWILYCALHSITAGNSVKSLASKWMGKRFPSYRALYSMVALVLLVPLLWLHAVIDSPLLFRAILPLRLLALALGSAGITGMAICLHTYVWKSAGSPGHFIEGARPALQRGGLHAYVRHPLYLSTFLLLWGLFLFRPSLAILIANTIITTYTLLAIRWEEKKLAGMYGREYEEYRDRTPMILPKPPLDR